MKNIIYYSLEKYINTASLAIYSFFVAKLFGPDIFGYISHKEAIIGVLSILALQSIDNIVQRELIHKASKTVEIISSGIFIKLVFVAISCGILLFMSFENYDDEIRSNIVWILFVMIPARSLTFLSSYLVVNNKAETFLIVGLSVTAISAIYKIFILYNHFDINYVIFGLVIDYVLYAIFYSFLLLKYGVIRFVINKEYMEVFIKEGLILSLSGAMIILYSRIDQIMLAQISGFNEVGLFSLSNKILFMYVVISTAFNLALIPKLNKSSADYHYQIKRFGRITFQLGAFMMMLNLIVSPIVINVFYGDKYIETEYLVALSSPIILLTFLSSSTGKILVMEGMSRHALYRNVLALISNVILNLILIPLWGAKGAVVASITAWFLSSAIYPFFHPETKSTFKIFCGLS